MDVWALDLKSFAALVFGLSSTLSRRGAVTPPIFSDIFLLFSLFLTLTWKTIMM